MKRLLLTMLGALAFVGNLQAMSADDAAMAALYPEHETFFQNELHPIAVRPESVMPEAQSSALVWTYVQEIQMITIKHVAVLR